MIGAFLPIAAVRIAADGVSNIPSIGCTAVKTATGVYTITLGQNGLDSAEGIFICTLELVTIGTVTMTHTSDTVKVVSTWNATVAADSPVYFFCARVAGGAAA